MSWKARCAHVHYPRAWHKLRVRRFALGISQIEMAKRVGLSPSAFNQLERGKPVPISRDRERKVRLRYELILAEEEHERKKFKEASQ